MRRLHLSKRLRRCRNECGTFQNGPSAAVAGQCISDSNPQTFEITFAPEVAAEQRAYHLSMCGVTPGDIDDLTGSRAKFYIGPIADRNIGANGELSNLQTLCTTCDEGAKNITTVKPPAIWLLSQIRRAGQEEQRVVLEWLRKKFKE
jgi:hypothetical protein